MRFFGTTLNKPAYGTNVSVTLKNFYSDTNISNAFGHANVKLENIFLNDAENMYNLTTYSYGVTYNKNTLYSNATNMSGAKLNFTQDNVAINLPFAINLYGGFVFTNVRNIESLYAPQATNFDTVSLPNSISNVYLPLANMLAQQRVESINDSVLNLPRGFGGWTKLSSLNNVSFTYFALNYFGTQFEDISNVVANNSFGGFINCRMLKRVSDITVFGSGSIVSFAQCNNLVSVSNLDIQNTEFVPYSAQNSTVTYENIKCNLLNTSASTVNSSIVINNIDVNYVTSPSFKGNFSIKHLTMSGENGWYSLQYGSLFNNWSGTFENVDQNFWYVLGKGALNIVNSTTSFSINSIFPDSLVLERIIKGIDDNSKVKAVQAFTFRNQKAGTLSNLSVNINNYLSNYGVYLWFQYSGQNNIVLSDIHSNKIAISSISSSISIDNSEISNIQCQSGTLRSIENCTIWGNFSLFNANVGLIENVNIHATNPYHSLSKTNIEDISQEFSDNLMMNSVVNNSLKFLNLSNSNNLSNSAIKNIVNSIVTYTTINNTQYANLSNSNQYSPFFRTKYDNSYYTEYHAQLNALGWKY